MRHSSSVAMLRHRAAMLDRARAFFASRKVLEVDTPILGEGLVVESHIDPIPCSVRHSDGSSRTRHLLTSPEGPMKRLLADGSGAIYQFAHAFRDGEIGRKHSPEFTMLEWYQPDMDHHALMNEVSDFVRALLPKFCESTFERVTYRQAFIDKVGIDPFATSLAAIKLACEKLDVPIPENFARGSIDDALDLILVSHIEPSLGSRQPLFLYDYPASQAALAQVRDDPDTGFRVADRFELYIDGVELANGYHELADPSEQLRRFEQANADRESSGRTSLPIDEALIDALSNGFPACSGVALGFDRLMMVATDCEHIADVQTATTRSQP
jgi:elongation factor P--(R)-beta-lysine ligase